LQIRSGVDPHSANNKKQRRAGARGGAGGEIFFAGKAAASYHQPKLIIKLTRTKLRRLP